MFVVLTVYIDAHSCFADGIQRAKRNEWSYVDHISVKILGLIELPDQFGGLLVHDWKKVVQYAEMEGWRQYLSPETPFGFLAGDQAFADPWLEEAILVRLVEDAG